MADYGPDTFRPTTKESRGFLARTLVTVYAPDEPTNPSIHLPDLPSDHPLYPYANVAVKLGWIPTYSNGKFGRRRGAGSLLDFALVKAYRFVSRRRWPAWPRSTRPTAPRTWSRIAGHT